jgi:hypothetical protein
VVRFVYQKNKIRARDQQAVQQEEAASLLTPTCQIALQTYPGDSLADLCNTISSLTITLETSNHLCPPADSITTIVHVLSGNIQDEKQRKLWFKYVSFTAARSQLAMAAAGTARFDESVLVPGDYRLDRNHKGVYGRLWTACEWF